jgi:hypothetical protein
MRCLGDLPFVRPTMTTTSVALPFEHEYELRLAIGTSPLPPAVVREITGTS